MTYIRKIRGEIVQLPLSLYNGIAKPGEIVIDEATYTVYVANSTGMLNSVGGGGGGGGTGNSILNGTSNIDIPFAGSNIKVNVSGVTEVLNLAPTQIDVKANIVPVGDAVYSLGSPTAQFKDLYLSNSTLYLDLLPVTVVSGRLQVNGANVVVEDPSGNIPMGNVLATGNVVADNINSNGNVIGSSITSSGAVTATGDVITNRVISRTGSLILAAVGLDQNISLSPTGVGYVTVNTTRIADVGTPIASTDAATKAYVDGMATGLNIKSPVAAATTGPLTGVYNNGASGIGATFTLAVPTSFLDGYAMQLNDRILIKDQLNQFENGIYVRTTTSVFTRTTDNDSPTEMDAAYCFVQNGTVNSKSSFVQTNAVALVGSSSAIFTQFSDAGDYSPGAGLTLTGAVFSITNTGVTAGTYGNANTIPSITVNSRGQITGVNNVAIDSNAANLTGTTLNSSIIYSSLTSLGTLSSLTVSGPTSLGPVGNVTITGGLPGQVLGTDGAGGLSWTSYPIANGIANGTSNVTIPVGAGNIVMYAGASLAANVTAVGITAGNLVANANINTSNLIVSGNSDLGAVANVKITGGTNGQILSTDGAGGLNWISAGGISSNIANGTSNVSIDTVNGDVGVSINGVANVLAVSSTGITVTGTSDLGTVSDVIISGGAAGDILSTDGAGGLNWISAGSAGSAISNGTSNVNIATNDGPVTIGVNGTPSVVTVTATGANIVGTANISGTANLGGALNVGGVSNLGPVGNVVITGGTSGFVLSTDGAGVLNWANSIQSIIANGVSNVSIPTASSTVQVFANGINVLSLSNPAVNSPTVGVLGRVNFLGVSGTADIINFGQAGFLYSKVDFGNVANVHLGAVANVRITGGTNGQILSTDGAGVLSWVSAGGATPAGTNTQVQFNDAGVFAGNAGLTYDKLTETLSVSNLTVTGNTIINSNLTVDGSIVLGTDSTNSVIDMDGAANVNIGTIGNVHIYGGTSGQVLSTDGAGELSWITIASGSLSNGTSDITIPTVNGVANVKINGTTMATFGTSNLTIMGDLSPFSNAVSNIGSNSLLMHSIHSNTVIVKSNLVTPSLISSTNDNIVIEGNLLPVSNITYDLGSSTQRWRDIYLSNNTIYLGDSALSISNSSLTVDGNAVVVQNSTGNTVIEGNIIAPGELIANGNIITYGDFVSFANLSIAGVSNLGPVGNVVITGGSNGQVLTTDGNGALTWTTVSGGGSSNSISNGTSNVIIPVADGLIAVVYNGNVVAQFGDYTGGGYGLRVSGNIISEGSGANGGGYIEGRDLNIYGNANLTTAGNVALGAVSNIHITGGSNGQVLTTDGSGNLSWTTASGGASNSISQSLNGGYACVQTRASQWDPFNALDEYVVQTNLYDPLSTANVTPILARLQQYTGNTFGTTVEVDAGGVVISANASQGDGTLLLAGSNTLTLSSPAGNIVISGNVVGSMFTEWDLSPTYLINLGNVSNLRISGGNSGEVLSTDGAGNVSWIAAGGGGTPTSIANGSSYVSFSGENGNVFVAANSAVTNFITDGSIVLPTVSNTKMTVSGTTSIVASDPYPAGGNGSVVVWTAPDTNMSGVKMVLRAQRTSGTVSEARHLQMMEIMMAKHSDGTAVAHTVSNRVKTDPTAADIGINVTLSAGALVVTAECGGDTYNFTYSITTFLTA